MSFSGIYGSRYRLFVRTLLAKLSLGASVGFSFVELSYILRGCLF
jgi:hypothetical protein